MLQEASCAWVQGARRVNERVTTITSKISSEVGMEKKYMSRYLDSNLVRMCFLAIRFSFEMHAILVFIDYSCITLVSK